MRVRGHVVDGTLVLNWADVEAAVERWAEVTVDIDNLEERGTYVTSVNVGDHWRLPMSKVLNPGDTISFTASEPWLR